MELRYRDATPPQLRIQGASAAEASAAVEGAALGAAAVKAADEDKTEFKTRETFIRQAGERCPKYSTKDIAEGHLSAVKGSMTRRCLCQRRGLSRKNIYRLDDYEAAVAVEYVA